MPVEVKFVFFAAAVVLGILSRTGWSVASFAAPFAYDAAEASF